MSRPEWKTRPPTGRRERFDAVVVGLGSVGSAAAYHLARDGLKVLGIDRFRPPHTGASHHGKTRIIREAYFEDPRYVPMVQQAYREWRRLERECGTELLRSTGGLMIGIADGHLIRGARLSAETHGLPAESLTVDEVIRRHPALRPAEGMEVLYEPRAGVLFPEACVQAHLDGARAAGAELRFDEPLASWAADGEGVRVETTRSTVSAERLVLSAGAWTSQLVPELVDSLEVERQVIHWFEPARPQQCRPEALPIFLLEHELGRYFYGFPDFGDGVKVAVHHEGAIVDPDSVAREVGEAEVAGIAELTRRFMPGGHGTYRESAVCFYTNTPDGNFILDLHPEHPGVLVASPCSGHGFKFSGVLGGAAAALLTDRPSPVDLSMFAFRR